jgi:hypothetical protein
VRNGVKLLGFSHRGCTKTKMVGRQLHREVVTPPVTAPLDLHFTEVSKSAREAVEAAGGSFTLQPVMNRVILRRLLKPEKAQLRHYPDPSVLGEIRELASA